MDRITELKSKVRKVQSSIDKTSIEISDPTQADIDSAMANLPKPPEPDLIERIPEPQRDNGVIPDKIQVAFMDGETLVIPLEWYNAYPRMREQPIMRTRYDFMKLVPILNGSTCKSTLFDTKSELDELFSLIRYFGIILTDTQLVEIHESAGLVELIHEAKQLIKEMDSKCFKKGMKKRLQFFRKYWNHYVELLVKIYKDDSYTNIDYDHMLASIDMESLERLLKLNILYNNQVTMFFTHIKKVVKEKNMRFLSSFVDSFEQTIPDEAKDLTTKMLEVVEKAGQNVLTGKLKALIDISKVIDKK